MMAPLPVFHPIEALPTLQNSDITLSASPTPDPDLLQAEAACKAGETARAVHYINRLQQAHTPVELLQSCLLAAVESASEDLVQLLLAIGVPVNSVVITPALQAANTSVLSLFVRHGWDLNQEEAWCVPPWLSLAIVSNTDHSLISWFLNNGADPNKACQVDTTPLSTAVSVAPLHVVRQLLDYCADDTVFRGQLLHFAARRTDNDGIEVVELVLRRCQPHINAVMWEDQPLAYECYKLTGLGTPLHEAAREGQPKVAEILLREGTDISLRDSCGKTALERAEIVRNDAVAELLRDAEQKRKTRSESKM